MWTPSPVVAARTPSETPVADPDDEVLDGCRALCSAEVLRSGPPTAATGSMQRRFEGNPTDIGEYVHDQTDDDHTIQVYIADVHMSNSAGFQEMGPEANAFNVGLKGMCGCTALFVVNPNGVYYAHYFEDPSFYPRRNFEDKVIKFLKATGGANGFPSLQDRIDIFNNEHTQAFIFTPQKYSGEGSGATGNNKKPQYEPEVKQLVGALTEILPLLPNPPTVYIYRAPNSGTSHGQNLMERFSNGRALFQYDRANDPPYRLYFEDYLQNLQYT
ncbi:hypothetical protein GP486_003575 [Trichoglossum hirsutum]|uniref:Uncharacterized protein n=1 Tax=Trichoglossum hirsutum TaxID=265104 RepID=A0A9P8LCT0_9PEZI|nr:hypothetical protein GP486_003575 [Trichoglossum hirsutum]